MKATECFIWYTGYHGLTVALVNGANMGPIWGQQDPDGPHVGPTNFAIWVAIFIFQWHHLLIISMFPFINMNQL